MQCHIRVSLCGRIHAKINCEWENKQWVALAVHFGIVMLEGGVALGDPGHADRT